MEQRFSTTETAEWLWAYLKLQGYEPGEYSPWEALREVSEHRVLFPDAPASWWFRLASTEAQQAFLTYWKQKGRNGLP